MRKIQLETYEEFSEKGDLVTINGQRYELLDGVDSGTGIVNLRFRLLKDTD